MGVDNTISKLKAYFEKWHKKESASHLELLYPIGSIYMNVNDVDPSILFPNTTWEKIEGRFLLGHSNEYPLFNSAGKNTTGGNKDTFLIKHYHTQKPHYHTQSGHNHTPPDIEGLPYYFLAATGSDGTAVNFWEPNPYFNINSISSSTNNSRKLVVSEEHAYITEPRATTTTAPSISNTTAENNTYGDIDSGTNMNMPPYIVVNIWKRTG